MSEETVKPAKAEPTDETTPKPKKTTKVTITERWASPEELAKIGKRN